ncbi:hypothetical protein N866_13620 [Actinotalea ferrariae CF5-4]|uniref:Holin n=1 Tax=Actinotalea ferrariae CF5-4 TaxID=948458 RepID=A0A021VYU5_9CELL|nr:hypothetical protein [Actinotalea ferrariae]EYR64252.1 hypothetical protein N866_13620 [Actinotalea ferrariae CF5-4]
MNDVIVSLIRTYVPVGVGAFLAWLLSLGIEVDAQTQAGLITSMTALVVAAYYTLVRLLERKWPAVGVLLGVPKQPEYEPRHAA